MPAPETVSFSNDARPVLGHVNLMVDTFIANAAPEDLRAIVRSLLASTPGLSATFTANARQRLHQTSRKSPSTSSSSYYFASCPTQHSSYDYVATPQLESALIRARSMYGVRMGFASLQIFTSIVQATFGLRWEDTSDMADILAVVDSDITQAIQSAKEEIDGGLVVDFVAARATVNDLRAAVNNSMREVQAWNGEFPFERASSSLRYWKL